MEYFAHVCTAPMLSKSEKMLMNLNSKQSNFASWQPQNSSPTRQGTAKTWQTRVWVWCLWLVVLSLSIHTHGPLFLSLMVTTVTAQEKGPLRDSKG